MPSEKLTGLLLKKKHGAEDSQQPAPTAPPPIQPEPANKNPYEFITAPKTRSKSKLSLPGGSKTARIIFAGVGATVLVMLIVTVMNLLNSGNANLKNDLATAASQQAELIRISDVGIKKSRQADSRNLAVTSKLSLISQQPGLLALAKKAGAKTDAKTLSLGVNPKTDTILTSADQSNNFDQEFIKVLIVMLQNYQGTLKKIYDSSSNDSTKTTLSNNYDAVDALLGKTKE